MIIEKMTKYLEDEDGVELWRNFALRAQLHSHYYEKAENGGYYDFPHSSTYTSRANCERQVAFYVRNLNKKPVDWQLQSLFALGYASEIYILALMDAAGIDLQLCQESYKLPWILGDQYIQCRPDAIATIDGRQVAVEIKSFSSSSFNRFLAVGLPDHYYDQVQLELMATNLSLAIVLAVSRGNGEMREVEIVVDKQRQTELNNRFQNVHSKTPNQIERGQKLTQPSKYQAGKIHPLQRDDVELPEGAVCTERYSVSGFHIGWDILLPEYQLTRECAWCAFKVECWNEFIITEWNGIHTATPRKEDQL